MYVAFLIDFNLISNSPMYAVPMYVSQNFQAKVNTLVYLRKTFTLQVKGCMFHNSDPSNDDIR